MVIRAEGRFAFFDLWLGSLFHSRRAITIFGGSAGLALIILLLEGSAGKVSCETLEPMIALSIFWMLFFPISMLYPCYRMLKRSPNLRGPVTYEFTADGYDLKATHSQLHTDWPALVKWREGKRCFLFYANPRMPGIVPKRFFQNSGDIDSLRVILQTNVPKK